MYAYTFIYAHNIFFCFFSLNSFDFEIFKEEAFQQQGKKNINMKITNIIILFKSFVW